MKRSASRLGWVLLAGVLVAGALVSGCGWLIGVTDDPYVVDDAEASISLDAGDAGAE